MLGEDPWQRAALVDVFLLSGEGRPEHRVQLFPGDSIGPGWESDSSEGQSFPYWRWITGMTHNLEPLPEEGLIHHVRNMLHFTWERDENGTTYPISAPFSHEVNTDEYSYGVKVRTESLVDGGGKSSLERSESMLRSWGGRVW